MKYRETSREAWEEWQGPKSDTIDAKILGALRHGGLLTCEEIEARIGVKHQSVSGNLRHLVERGFVEKSGEFGKTRSGRRAIKWRLSYPQVSSDEDDLI